VRCVCGGFEVRVGCRTVCSGVITVELVPGRERGEELPLRFASNSARSPAFRFLDDGRTGVARSGFPKARPAAAIPTVLDATSCEAQSQFWSGAEQYDRR
jgi:hypothetical protein